MRHTCWFLTDNEYAATILSVNCERVSNICYKSTNVKMIWLHREINENTLLWWCSQSFVPFLIKRGHTISNLSCLYMHDNDYYKDYSESELLLRSYMFILLGISACTNWLNAAFIMSKHLIFTWMSRIHLNLQSRNMSKYLQPTNFAIVIFDGDAYMLQYQIVIVNFVCSKTPI